MNINPEKNHRILVIDDNPAIHQDFHKILGTKNRTWITAYAGQERGVDFW